MLLRKWAYDYGVDHIPPLLPAHDFEILYKYSPNQ